MKSSKNGNISRFQMRIDIGFLMKFCQTTKEFLDQNGGNRISLFFLLLSCSLNLATQSRNTVGLVHVASSLVSDSKPQEVMQECFWVDLLKGNMTFLEYRFTI